MPLSRAGFFGFFLTDVLELDALDGGSQQRHVESPPSLGRHVGTEQRRVFSSLGRRGSCSAHYHFRVRHLHIRRVGRHREILLGASPVPATDPERSEPGGAGVRGRGALSGGSTPGARGAKGCGFESFRALPKSKKGRIGRSVYLKAANKRSETKRKDKRHAAIVPVFVSPPWIAPQLRAQGHVEARRQKVLRLRGHAAKDRLAIRRDAAARRQRLAEVGVAAAKVLDLLWRPLRPC